MPSLIKGKNGKLFNSNLYYKKGNILKLNKNLRSKEKFKNKKEKRLDNNCLYTCLLEDFWSNKLKLDKNYFIVKEIVNICEKAMEDREVLNNSEFNKIKELAKKTGYKITKKDLYEFKIELETDWFYMTKMIFDASKSKYKNVKDCEFHMNNLEKIISVVKKNERILKPKELIYFDFVKKFLEKNEIN